MCLMDAILMARLYLIDVYVFDPVGYGADGNFGNDWAMTIWISDRGVQSGKLNDILVHEAAHAYSYLVLKECILQDGTTFRELAHQKYGDDENLAAVSYTHLTLPTNTTV